MGDDFVTWEDRYSMGIPLIDDQHKELLVVTNELYDSCRQGNEAAGAHFKETISKAVEYVKIHFSTEEKLMAKINFPELAEHKREHEEFVRKVLEEVKNFESGKTFVPNAFVRFLREWVLTHIAMSDIKYAEFIQKLKKKAST